jgi:hypothetical protein
VAPPLDEISRFNAAGQAEADDMNVRQTEADMCTVEVFGMLHRTPACFGLYDAQLRLGEE